jgi:hypothetical protein
MYLISVIKNALQRARALCDARMHRPRRAGRTAAKPEDGSLGRLTLACWTTRKPSVSEQTEQYLGITDRQRQKLMKQRKLYSCRRRSEHKDHNGSLGREPCFALEVQGDSMKTRRPHAERRAVLEEVVKEHMLGQTEEG